MKKAERDVDEITSKRCEVFQRGEGRDRRKE
jgi:hypothetical protein